MEPTSDEIKEVYARFGLAYYMAECVHRGLCNLYSASQMPKDGPVTRPRVEEHLRVAFETTLGQLVPKLSTVLPSALVPKVERVVERRNHIAHHFWYERIHLTSTQDGVGELLRELSADVDLFSELNEEIEELLVPFHARIGLTQENLELALADAMGGKDFEPLIGQRRPKKEETIVAAYNVPVADGRKLLVFQTEDGGLWQLCDAGLGWTSYDAVAPTWPSAEKFDDVLPAKVNPRPPVTAPWNFDLRFGKKATLSVQAGKAPGQIIYKLKRHA